MCHLTNAHYKSKPAGGNTGWFFLSFGGTGHADQYSNCTLGRMYYAIK